MIKKISAILAAILLCLSFAGCAATDDAPDGMMSVTVEGEPFKLYVPKSWTDNTSSGISGAIYSPALDIVVSARYHTLAEEPALADHVNSLVESYSQSLELFDLVENAPATLGGKDAVKLIYKAKHADKDFTFVETVTIHGADAVTLRMHFPTEHYEANASLYDTVAEAFVLCEKSEVTNDCFTDKKTPEGMKIASADHLEYRLYVPTSWVCNSESGKSEAYVSESGKPNVTVSFIAPSTDMTVEEYFAECEKQYKDSLSGYELLSSTPREVAEKDAISYVYRVKYGETSFVIMQTVLVYSSRVYSITYTALESSFDAHLGDVDAILGAFTFR